MIRNHEFAHASVRSWLTNNFTTLSFSPAHAGLNDNTYGLVL